MLSAQSFLQPLEDYWDDQDFSFPGDFFEPIESSAQLSYEPSSNNCDNHVCSDNYVLGPDWVGPSSIVTTNPSLPHQSIGVPNNEEVVDPLSFSTPEVVCTATVDSTFSKTPCKETTIGQSSRKRKRTSSTRPKRPPSSFVLFCSERRPELKKQYPTFNNIQLTKELSGLWKQLLSSQKEKYQAAAAKLQAEFKAKYPVYKYNKRRKTENKENEPTELVNSTNVESQALQPMALNSCQELAQYLSLCNMELNKSAMKLAQHSEVILVDVLGKLLVSMCLSELFLKLKQNPTTGIYKPYGSLI